MFEESKYKIVNYPIRVPRGEYCWTLDGPRCQFFDNTVGHPSCYLDFFEITITPKGYKKAKCCQDFMERK